MLKATKIGHNHGPDRMLGNWALLYLALVVGEEVGAQPWFQRERNNEALWQAYGFTQVPHHGDPLCQMPATGWLSGGNGQWTAIRTGVTSTDGVRSSTRSRISLSTRVLTGSRRIGGWGRCENRPTRLMRRSRRTRASAICRAVAAAERRLAQPSRGDPWAGTATCRSAFGRTNVKKELTPRAPRGPRRRERARRCLAPAIRDLRLP